MGQRTRFTLLIALATAACAAPVTAPSETQRLGALVDALQQRLNRTEARINELSERLLVQSSARPVPPAPAAPLAAPELFQRALKQYQAGKPARAYEDFASFVRANPKHPDADSALYWMGQCKFDAEAYADAVGSYVQLANGYPQSSKAAEALFQAGVAFEKLQQIDKARAMFARLIAAYPHSASAELARSRERPTEDDHAP